MDWWLLDPAVVHLNHGSFGACPRPVLDAQDGWRRRFEENPTRFVAEVYEPALASARQALAGFVGADPEGMAFVANATAGVNTVLGSLDLAEGDEVVVTDHVYGAVGLAVRSVTERNGSRVVTASIPLPVDDPGEVAERVLSRVSERTRLVVVEHVTSPTALVFAVGEIARALEPSTPVLVDGAHAPGMVELDIARIGASFYVGNCHKWLCAPRGAGFVVVAESRRDSMRPLVVSHGWASDRPGRFQAMFDWPGTFDPSAWLSVPAAIEAVGSIVEGSWPALRQRNRALARAGRVVLAERLGVPRIGPDSMMGAMAAVPLPHVPRGVTGTSPHPLTETLRSRWAIEAPVVTLDSWPGCLVRASAHAYNRLEDFERLADALVAEVGRAPTA